MSNFFLHITYICVTCVSPLPTFDSHFRCGVELDVVLGDEAQIVSTVTLQNGINEETAIGNTGLIFRKYKS